MSVFVRYFWLLNVYAEVAGRWDAAERMLAHRLVDEAVDMNELRRNYTDVTQLGQVRLSSSLSLSFSLSLSLIPGRGAGHRPNPFQVAPEASRVGCEGVSWPGVPPGVIVGRTLELQMLDRLVGAVAVWADGRVPAPDTVKVSCYQWGMTSAYLCHCHALDPGPIPLPTLVTVVAW